jgi:hypothetical protein
MQRGGDAPGTRPSALGVARLCPTCCCAARPALGRPAPAADRVALVAVWSGAQRVARAHGPRVGSPGQRWGAADAGAAGRARQKTPGGTGSHAGAGTAASGRAGPPGPPAGGESQGRKGRRHRRPGTAGRGPWEQARTPVLGMSAWGGPGVSPRLAQGQQKPSAPRRQAPLESGPLV